MQMRIINLIEDTLGASECIYEHGLSFYIETSRHKLLLDTGVTDAFIKNACKKGIDLKQIDTVILSHGHYDHTGGVMAFTKLNPNAKIYISKNATGDFYNVKNGGKKYIGIDKEIALLSNTVFVDGNLKIDDELFLFSGVKGKRLWPKGNTVLKAKYADGFIQDEFEHEQYLVVSQGNETVLLSGCAHKGILNILDEYFHLFGAYPTRVVSGFHTMKDEYTQEDELIIFQTAQELAKTNIVFYSGHCTGEYPMKILKQIMGEQLVAMHSGDEIMP